MSASTSKSVEPPKFSGHNWEDLNRWVSRTKFETLLNNDLRVTQANGTEAPDPKAQCAYLAQNCEGPALDWIASTYSTNPAIFNDFDGFVTALRQGFGVADDNIQALCRAKLNDLKMGTDVPVFFAEADRLFLALGIDGHEPRIAHITAKLPHAIKIQLAEQGRMFHNYETMREWLNTRWALMPGANQASTSKRPRCGNCGKKGHVASDCRKSKN
jgi:hypothetical protein